MIDLDVFVYLYMSPGVLDMQSDGYVRVENLQPTHLYGIFCKIHMFMTNFLVKYAEKVVKNGFQPTYMPKNLQNPTHV